MRHHRWTLVRSHLHWRQLKNKRSRNVRFASSLGKKLQLWATCWWPRAWLEHGLLLLWARLRWSTGWHGARDAWKCCLRHSTYWFFSTTKFNFIIWSDTWDQGQRLAVGLLIESEVSHSISNQSLISATSFNQRLELNNFWLKSKTSNFRMCP